MAAPPVGQAQASISFQHSILCDATRRYYLHEVGQFQTMSAPKRSGSHSIIDVMVEEGDDWSVVSGHNAP